LVNNAAIVPNTLNHPDLSKFNPLADTSDETWAREIGVSLSGVFYCMRAAAKPMISQKYGKIITISSIVAMTGGMISPPIDAADSTAPANSPGIP
ncbi:MAG: SDR family NAD(P)-dependent oxidoreductase, partial [Desulfobacteraceae bacterium]